MYDSSAGTERFCIRQLLKPLENVSLPKGSCWLCCSLLLPSLSNILSCRLFTWPMISLRPTKRHKPRSSWHHTANNKLANGMNPSLNPPTTLIHWLQCNLLCMSSH